MPKRLSSDDNIRNGNAEPTEGDGAELDAEGGNAGVPDVSAWWLGGPRLTDDEARANAEEMLRTSKKG